MKTRLELSMHGMASIFWRCAFGNDLPSQPSMQRIRDKVKAALGRNTRPTLQEKLDRLNPILRGWSTYFGWLHSVQYFRKVDQFVTWKLRRWSQASASADGGRFGKRHWPIGARPACT